MKIKPTSTEYGAFLIKPDALKLGMADEILKDIHKTKLKVEYTKNAGKLDQSDIRRIWSGNEFSDYVWDCISQRYVREDTIAVIVSSRHTDEPIHKTITRIKGRPKKRGLRGKYQFLDKEDCRRMFANEKEYICRVGNTRVHGTGSGEEFKWLVETLLTGRDMDRLRVDNNNLFQKLSRYDIR